MAAASGTSQVMVSSHHHPVRCTPASIRKLPRELRCLAATVPTWPGTRSAWDPPVALMRKGTMPVGTTAAVVWTPSRTWAMRSSRASGWIHAMTPAAMRLVSSTRAGPRWVARMPDVSSTTTKSPSARKGNSCKAYPPSGTANASRPTRLPDGELPGVPGPVDVASGGHQRACRATVDADHPMHEGGAGAAWRMKRDDVTHA